MPSSAIGGRHIVIRHSEVRADAPDLAPGDIETFEGLRARHLVHEVTVDVQQRRAVGLGMDDMLVPDLVVERARGSHAAILGLPQRRDDLRRRLHQLDQHALAAERKLLVALRMDEADVVAGRALADAARREAHARAPSSMPPPPAGRRPTGRRGSAACVCTAGFVAESSGCIRSTSTARGSAAQRADVFVDVLALGDEVALHRQPEAVDPQRAAGAACRGRRWRSAACRGCGRVVLPSRSCEPQDGLVDRQALALASPGSRRPRRPAWRSGCSPSSSPR